MAALIDRLGLDQVRFRVERDQICTTYGPKVDRVEASRLVMIASAASDRIVRLSQSFSLTHAHTHPHTLSPAPTPTYPPTLSYPHPPHTHTLSLPHPHTHTLYLSLSLSLSLTHTHTHHNAGVHADAGAASNRLVCRGARRPRPQRRLRLPRRRLWYLLSRKVSIPIKIS